MANLSVLNGLATLLVIGITRTCGDDFALCFLRNPFRKNDHGETGETDVYVTSDVDWAFVTVYEAFNDMNQTVLLGHKYERFTFQLDASITMLGLNMIENKGIMITSVDNIYVLGFSKALGTSSEVFTPRPVHHLGIMYVALTTCQQNFPHRCEIGVMAVLEPANITVYIPAQFTGTIGFNGTTYQACDVIQLTLQPLQTVQFATNADLTGTLISSDHEIAAFAGADKTRVIADNARNHLSASLPPLNHWGKHYIVARESTSLHADLLKVVSSKDDTIVLLSGCGFTTLFLRRAFQDHFNYSFTCELLEISADNEVLVSHFVVKTEWKNAGMYYPIPVQHYTNEYVVPVAPFYQGCQLSLVARDGQQNTILVQDMVISAQWASVSSSSYVVTTVNVSNTEVVRVTDISGAPFGGHLTCISLYTTAATVLLPKDINFTANAGDNINPSPESIPGVLHCENSTSTQETTSPDVTTTSRRTSPDVTSTTLTTIPGVTTVPQTHGTTTTHISTQKFTTTTHISTQEFTTTSQPSTQEFTITSQPTTQKFTTISQTSTQEFTTTSQPTTQEFTTTTQQSTTEFTTTSQPTSQEFPTISQQSTQEFTTTSQQSTQELTTTPQQSTTELTTTSQQSTTEFTTTPQTSTQEFTTPPQTSTQEFTTTTQQSTTEFTTTSQPSTQEFTTTPQQSTTEFTTTSQPSTQEFTSTQQTSTQEFTTTPQTSTQEFTTTTQQSTTEFTTTSQPSTQEFTTTPQQSTTEFTTTSQPSTTEFTTTSQTSTQEFTTTSQPSTQEFTTTPQISTQEFTTNPQPSISDVTTTPQTTSHDVISTQQATSSDVANTSQTTIPDVTTMYLNTSAVGLCQCVCFTCKDLGKNVTPEVFLAKYLEHIEATLTLRRNETVRWRRTLTSADDSRVSSRIMGYVGILVISSTVGVLILADLCSLCAY